MKNLIEDDFYDDFENIDAERELEKIQIKSLAESILRDTQITRSSHFKRDIKKIIKYHIKRFFKNKKNKDGETLNLKFLYSKFSIEKIFNFNILESTKLIYENLKDTNYIEKSEKEKDVTKDIILVNESLKKIYKSKVPQCFAGGMLLLYLEFCRGIKIDEI